MVKKKTKKKVNEDYSICTSCVHFGEITREFVWCKLLSQKVFDISLKECSFFESK